jgi:hypothetical protein
MIVGRMSVIASTTGQTSVAHGGGTARAFLKVIFVSVIALESLTADPFVTIGTYMHRGVGTWLGVPIFLSPLEIILMLGVVVALASTSSDVVARRSRSLSWPMALFGLALVGGFARGAVGGGDMYVGMWEIRYLLYIPACFLIARAGIRRAEHVASLLGAGLVAATLFAIEGAYRKFALVNTGALGVIDEFSYEHEDVIFLATFLIAIAASVLFPASARVRSIGLLLAPILLLTLLASNRRAGIIVLLIGLLILALAAFAVRRKAFFAAAVPGAIATIAYMAIFWNASGIIGQPARAVRSMYEPDARDASSNLYRLLEGYNINATLQDDPVFGVGFGRPFLMPATLPDLSWWPFWHYEPHNNVLWMWLKLGVGGYLVFWSLIGSAISRAAAGVRRLQDPQLRLAALFCLTSIVAVVVFAYVDLGFVSGRVTSFLGIVIGIVSVLKAIDRPVVAAREVRI